PGSDGRNPERADRDAYAGQTGGQRPAAACALTRRRASFAVHPAAQGLRRGVSGMAGDHEAERLDEAEGGPVKTFLEHLEDFRWVLIKSIVALFLGMLICLFAANHVIQIIKWPLKH